MTPAMHSRPPTPGLARLVPKGYRAPRTYISIVDRAAALTGYTRAELVGPSRVAPLCHVRWAICLALSNDGRTPNSIGRLLNRDRSTALHSIERARALRDSDADFAVLFDLIAAR